MTTTAAIRAALGRKDLPGARRMMAALLGDVTGQEVADLKINHDAYSLNSVNGFVTLGQAGACFFKFHQEEGEDVGVREYYNAAILEKAGYPVDMPLFAATEPGRQVLIYRRRHDRRFSDLCRQIEQGPAGAMAETILETQRRFDETVRDLALENLHTASAAHIAAEPVLQLFYHRLVDDPKAREAPATGGRARRFYWNRVFDLPGGRYGWDDIAEASWRINGRDYAISLRQAFHEARQNLSPSRFGPGPAFAAHGDAHNANIWFTGDGGEEPPRLVMFDPAFAGAHVPALLAEIKASFHNIFAHPDWLYNPDDCASGFSATARLRDGVMHVETDWRLTPLRRGFLVSKAQRYWRPLLAELNRRGQLAADWQAIMRSALFACPTLVMALRAGAGGHNPVSSAIGLAQAIRAAAAPEDGPDDFTEFFERMAI
ncbi:MAG TPA: hypothetical protein ENK41_05035 [Rhodobacteraceae bacterium]|nr:hypothetical protein [Paracoccaceae bacterium]